MNNCQFCYTKSTELSIFYTVTCLYLDRFVPKIETALELGNFPVLKMWYFENNMGFSPLNSLDIYSKSYSDPVKCLNFHRKLGSMPKLFVTEFLNIVFAQNGRLPFSTRKYDLLAHVVTTIPVNDWSNGFNMTSYNVKQLMMRVKPSWYCQIQNSFTWSIISWCK